MKLPARVKCRLARLRYSAYRAAKRIMLGRLCGGALGSGVVRDIEESACMPELARRIVAKRILAQAYVQTYAFPASYPPWFTRSEAFAARHQYLLSDVFVSPFSGAMWIHGAAMLQQSIGSLPRTYSNTQGAIETLLPWSELDEEKPVCIAPSRLEYYHWLLEALPEILHAKTFRPDCKIITGDKPRRYLVDSLSFLGVPEDNIIQTKNPVRAKMAILTPRWVNSGFIPQTDVNTLREAILPRLNPIRPHRFIYISRSRSKNRPMQNEKELEVALEENGFDICHFEDMEFQEQMQTCFEAKFIVAPHGAGLSNIIACQSGVGVHELISTAWTNTCYAKLAIQLGLSYSYTMLQVGHNGCIETNIVNIITTIIERIRAEPLPNSPL